MTTRVSPVLRRTGRVQPVAPPRGAPFYIALGIAAGLIVLTAVAAAVLFMRESQSPVQAAAPEPAVLEKTVSTPAASPVVEPAPPQPSIPATPARRPPKPNTAVTPFQGSVFPAESDRAGAKQDAPAEPVEQAEAPEKSEPPELQNEAKSEPAADSAEPPAGASVAEARRSGRLKRVFGSMLRPFRGKRAAEP